MNNNNVIVIPENPVSRFLFSDSRSALIWLIIRVYVGFAWLKAGWGKVTSDAWTGENAGAALQGFIGGALAKSAEGGDVSGWYATFLENVVLPNAKVFGFMVAYGEVLVGLGLIFGLLTGIAAFFGAFMNVSFLFAGTLSTNPLLFILATWLVLAWKVAGWYGLDRWALPKLGTPWTKKEKG
ncbi:MULTISPECIES: DoxX family membrane protein [Sporosarcina]|uniref:DoxX family protein n=1 Tax=Sporosarcina contaminans TaxID=633403 RepID=A0ABW3TV64_9BACL